MKEIDKIIEKYFDGETSLQEEQMLRNYFLQPRIADEHKVYAPMFNFFEEERKAAAPAKKKKKLSLYLWAGIAASILLITGVRFLNNSATDNDTAKSVVYINGKKVSDIQTINIQALISIKNISEIDTDALDSQIAILDSFTD